MTNPRRALDRARRDRGVKRFGCESADQIEKLRLAGRKPPRTESLPRPALGHGRSQGMTTYLLVLEMKKLLGSLDTLLEKATQNATAKKYDVNTLLSARLAPDMFPFVRQVQATCDQAKYAVARTTGKEPPSHPDTEQTVPELRARIASVIAYVASFSEGDFATMGERRVTTPRWEGRSMSAPDYLVEHAVPNFFFHLSMAYAILRHNGVEIGKRDYLGALSLS